MNPRRFFLIATPYLWLLLFFLVPFGIVLKIALSDTAISIPPYTPVLDLAEGWAGVKAFFADLDVENFTFLASDPLYITAYISSLKIALISTFITLLVGYPIAYGMAQAPDEWRPTLMMLVILPFWTSSLLRTYAMIGMLKANGMLSTTLAAIGLLEPGAAILHTDLAVYIGIVYNYLPFMVLPLTATLMRLDFRLLEAAADLGARPWQGFLRVTLPLSMPGIMAGALLVFIPAVGEFVIPDILGGPDALTIGRVLWTEFFTNRDWPLAAAVAVAMLLLIVIPTLVFEYVENRRERREAHA